MSPFAHILKLLHSIFRSFTIKKVNIQIIHQLNLGSEQHTPGLSLFLSSSLYVFSFATPCFSSTQFCIIQLYVDKLNTKVWWNISQCMLFYVKPWGCDPIIFQQKIPSDQTDSFLTNFQFSIYHIPALTNIKSTEKYIGGNVLFTSCWCAWHFHWCAWKLETGISP